MIIRKTIIGLLVLFLGCSSAYKDKFKQGIICYDRKEYGQAIHFFSLSLSLRPDYSDGYLWRAKSFFALKEYPKALKDISLFISIQKTPHFEAHLLRGDTFFALRQYKKAFGEYNRAEAVNQNSSLLYHKRGLFYIAIEAFKRAKSDLKYALKLDPHNAIIYCDLGKYYFFKKQYKTAIDYLTKAIAIKPDYPAAHYFLGRAYLGAKNKSKAFDQCTALSTLDLRLKNRLLNFYLKEKDPIWEKRKF